MGQGVHTQELPGIGKRYDVDLGRPDRRVSIIVHRHGQRDLYVFASTGDEPTAVLELSEETARKIGAVLAGTFFDA